MNKNKENIVPELRFPEFVNSKSWEMITLGELCNYWNGASHESNVVEDGDYYLISLNSLDINGNLKTDMKRISNTDYSLQKHDLVMVLSDVAHGNFLGLTDIIPNEKYVLNQRMAGLRLKKPNFTDAYYLKTLINYNQSYFKQKGQGSSQLNLAKSSVTDFNVLIPCEYEERKKIADCLSSLDELITAQNNKIELLKSHKKGLIQNLFPAEGETKPKLRFKKFEKDGDWVKIRLIDTVDKNVKWSFTGGPFGSNLKVSDYIVKGIRIIQLQNIGDGKFNDEYKIYTSIEKANELLSCNIYPGDIIISKMGDPVGRACLIPNSEERFVMSSDGIRLVVDEKKYDKYFIYSLINSVSFRSTVENNSTGSTRKRIGLDVLKNLSMIVPTNLKEQKYISELLYSLDNKLEAESIRLNELKNHKKGLMQKLFPRVNE